MNNTKKTIFLSCLFLGLSAPASALIPAMVPDVCLFGSCVQFTQTTALAQIQSLYQQVTMIANQTTNLASLGTLQHQAITQNVGTILGTGQTTTPLSIGNVAAQQTAQQAPATAQAVAHTDTLAQSANGAQQQAQVSNLYLSTIAGEAIKSNTMAAQEQVQKQNVASAEIAGLQQFFSGKTAANAEQP